MPLRRLVVALIAGGLLFSSAAADAQDLRERGQNVAPAQAADAARVMTDVKYGPHQRNVMDIWLARSDKPTPVLVSIHGGGFRAGNKSVEPALRDQCLAAGISVVAITYRLSQDAIAPASFHDSARAIQFIRHNSKEWNLDPKRIAATGGSAGAGLSLWLGFHDDLADTGSADPVLRQSSRLSGMVVNDGQSSYDPRVIRRLFPGTDTYKHPALSQLYDVDLDQLDNLPAEKYKLFEEVSPVDHLTKDDPPAMLVYGNPLNAQITSPEIGAHHPKFGVLLKEKMDALGIRCEVYAAGEKMGGGQTTTPFAFLKQVLGVE
jgi:acetyl esterase